LAELPGLDERSSLLPLITSNRENCLGSQCPSFKTCHVNQARREALAADVVVINHHLFFADMAVRESGMAELLPSVRVVIFDEAHQLNETGVHFLGRQLSTAQLLDLTRDTLATGLQLARGLVDWQAVCAELERDARDWRLCAGRYSGSVKLRWVDSTPEGLDEGAWSAALGNLTQSLQRTMAALDSVSEIAPDFLRLHDRAASALDQMEAFAKECAVDEVRWLDVSASQMRMMQAPLDISETVQQKMLVAPSPHPQEQESVVSDRPRSWIFTSATLGDDDKLTWFTQPCGLHDATVLRVSSPFDYPQQAALYVPRDVVLPNQPQHSEQVAHKAIEAARVLHGRTLVLTTTLRALRQIGEIMRQQLAGSGLEVLIQGEKSKRELMQLFRAGAQGATQGFVLVASASFWEGFDVPGNALELVIIDKLPFPVPNDPVVEARSQRLEQQKRSPFTDFFVPEAAVALKQGVGRLIRHEQDRGGLMICDKRLVTTGYGKRLLAALPPMRRIEEADQWHSTLVDLASTRVSTTP
jgi:ATP-dependent DNA helicase DinG